MLPLIYRVLVGGGLLVAGIAVASPPSPQVVTSNETPLRAIGGDAARRQANPPDSLVSYFAHVLPTQSAEGIDRVDPVSGYQFTAMKVIVSVAPGVFAGSQDISGGQSSKSLGALRHLNAHITLHPLNAAGQVAEQKRGGPVLLSTLEISPSEPAFADRVSNAASVASTAVTEATSTILPGGAAVGGVVQAFRSSIHRRPAATQVSYMTGANAFGWRWYESLDSTIEGLHYGTALIQIADEVKSIRVNIDLVADWRAFGVWSKSFEFTYALTKPGA